MIEYFPDPLHFKDGGMKGESRIFRLLSDFRYVSSYGTITVPAGFETDGASIPKAFWNILAPFGRYFHAAVIHDYLYRGAGFSRKDSDLIFKEAMYNSGLDWQTRETIYRAVRLFGGHSYCAKR